MAYTPNGTYAPAGGAAGPYFQRKQMTASVVVGSTGWGNLNTALDLTLAASVGQVVSVGVSGVWLNEATVVGFLDAVTIVGGAPVNNWSFGAAELAGGSGPYGWTGAASFQTSIGPSIPYKLQAADISAGTVLIRLRTRTSTAANKTLYSDANNTFMVWALNNG